MTKKSIFRAIGLFLVSIFTFSFIAIASPSDAEASSSYNVWRELRNHAKRDSVQFMRRIWQEYQNDYIEQIRERNRWRRIERQDAYKAHREAMRSNYNYNGRYNNAPQCVYYITATNNAGRQVVLGQIQTRHPLTERQEAMLQLLTNHIRSGEPISTAGMALCDQCAIRAFAQKLGIPIRVAHNIIYVN